MRIGTEKCPRRVGSDDLKPLTTICEEGVEIKGIRAHLRRVENYSGRGRGSSERAFLGFGTSSFSNKPSTTGSSK